MQYRPEIDGLRAIAIIPVILFHADFEWFRGGFIGVDIFFVISGFLITCIIRKGRAEGTFCYGNFFARRARRILPGLFVMLLLTSVAYIMFVQPSLQEVDLLRKGTLSSTLFCSNLYFAFSSGYFAAGSELLPFIHTWSLSVEEQFYLLYPALLLTAYRMGKKGVFFFLISVFILSISAAHVGTQYLGKWNFYLLPTRAWELAIGAFCSFMHAKQSQCKNQIISLLGLGLITFSILSFDENSKIPGLMCLVPTIGTSLILLFCHPGTWTFAILSNGLLVRVGLVSYGAYLWHQPILAVARHFCIHPMQVPLVATWTAIALTFVLAIASYHLVEKPFRTSRYRLNWLPFLALTLVMISLIAEYLLPLGIKSRSVEFSKLARDLARDDYDATRKDSNGYHFGTSAKELPDLLLLGDSHARMLIPNLSRELAERNLYGFHPYDKKTRKNYLAIADETSPDFLNSWLEKTKRLALNAKLVVISFRHSLGSWNYFHAPALTTSSTEHFQKLEVRLLQLAKFSKKLIIIGPVPETPDWGPNLGRGQFGQTHQSLLSQFKNNQIDYLNFLVGFKKRHSQVMVLFPHEFLLAEDGKSLRTFEFDTEGHRLPLYYDDDHLNERGSKKIIQRIFD